MSKKITAMQSLIKMLEIERDALEHDKYPQRTAALQMAIKFAKIKLSDEQQQIEEGWVHGWCNRGYCTRKK